MNKFFSILLILLVGLILRLWNVDIPLLEFYPTRQVQTAEITQNLIKDNFNFLYPRVDYFGPDNVYYLYEFPGYNLIVAGLDKLLGDVNDVNGRLVSIFSYLAATFFLYRISRILFNDQVVYVTVLFFSLSPLNILTSRSFQPDEMMLASSLGALYFLIQWSKRKTTKYLVMSCLFLAWAVLIKVVAVVFLFLPIIYIFLNQKARKYYFLPFIYFLTALIPSVFWYFHTFNVSIKLNTASSSAFNLFIWFGPENLKSYKYYSTLFGHEYNLVLLPIGMMLFVIGLFTRLSREQRVAYWWLAGTFLYFLFFNKHSMTHEYYHLPFLPIASIFIGIAADKVFNSLNRLLVPKALLILLISLVLAVLMLPSTLSRAYKPIERFSSVPATANALREISKPDDLIVGVMDRGPTIVYYSDRVGWNLGLDREQQQKEEDFYANKKYVPSTPQQDLEGYIARGAKYLAIANLDQFNDNIPFKEFVVSRFSLIRSNDKYLIFDLSFIKK